MAWLGRMREGEEREGRGDGKEDLNRSGLGERGGGVKANKFICHSHKKSLSLSPRSPPPPPPTETIISIENFHLPTSASHTRDKVWVGPQGTQGYWAQEEPVPNSF